MKDLGRVYDYELPRPSKKLSKPAKHYDSITVNGKDFPDLAKKDVGHECVVTVKARKKGERIEKREGQNRHDIELEMMGMDTNYRKPGSIDEAAKRLKHEYK